MKEGIIIVAVAITAFFAILFWKNISAAFTGESKSKNEVKKEKKKDKKGGSDENAQSTGEPGTTVQILERWALPDELKEISGISFMGNGEFACVQDESGTIYFYSTVSEKIERQVNFTGAGDFEGIASVGNVLYVVRADGKLYEIKGYDQAKPSVREHETGLTVRDNIESLCYDSTTNRLLMMGKDEDKTNTAQRRIYAFDLKAGKMVAGPVITLDLNNSIVSGSSKKNESKFAPSDMAIHPGTREIYITDGPASKLYILDKTGIFTRAYQFDSKAVPQAEGVSFSPEGEVYISTEAAKETGAIMKIKMD